MKNTRKIGIVRLGDDVVTRKDTWRQQLEVFRAILSLVGGIMIILALAADRLGYGDSGSFGIGQFLLILAGLSVLLIGLLGKRFTRLYRDAAIIFLNMLVILAFFELGAIIIGRTVFRHEQSNIESLPYYSGQDWAATYWQDAKQAQAVRYEPYVIWRHVPFAGKMVNFDQEGIRQTLGAECSPDAHKVFMFGGSTLLGWGSPDWGTIPAYVQSALKDRIKRPVCVINFGEDGYVSTQNLVGLVLQLQSGNIPDVVIFYDGINEVIAASESGQPSVHVTLTKIAARFEEKDHPLVMWGKKTRIYKLLERWSSNLGYSVPEKEIVTQNLAASVTNIYLGNYRVVGALAQEYAFDYYFFLQPHLAVGEKVLTNKEQAMRSSLDLAMANLAEAFYENIASVAPDYKHLWYLADIFDEEKTQIYIDDVGHITPEGNRLVAQEILGRIESRLAEK